MLSNKSNPLSHMITNGSKNQKNYFLMYFEPVTRVSDLSGGLQDIPLRPYFFIRIYLSDYIIFKNSLD